MSKGKRIVWATVQCAFEGWHHWPDAPEPVDYLANLHRHIFHVMLSVQVWHGDREIEYHMLEKALGVVCDDLGKLLDKNHHSSLSCEMMADCIFERFNIAYPRRRISVAVGEDGFNPGAVLIFEPDESES